MEEKQRQKSKKGKDKKEIKIDLVFFVNSLRTADLLTVPSASIMWGSFYRWISSSHSKLYDPALHRLVHRLICKVFHQLISEIKKLGGSIIYASFNKVRKGNKRKRHKRKKKQKEQQKRKERETENTKQKRKKEKHKTQNKS